ncbi:CAAX amino protease [Clostridia bacterium]|nr:CAAX amino protease [Clostridia bacterium]
MEIKPPKTHKEQIKILRDRGCVIADEAKALDVLSAVNYYRLSGYFFPFRGIDDAYLPGTTFERIAAIYAFDGRLRAVLLHAIGNAEIAARTSIAYFVAHKYGALGYLDATNFKKKYKPSVFLEEFADAVRHNQSSMFVQHHMVKYDGKFPIWVAVELFTMGMTSKMFSNLRWSDQRKIAKTYNASPEELQSLLYCLTILRNACAHYDRLYAMKFKATPRFPIGFAATADNSLFSLICVLKLLGRDEGEWRTSIVRDISALIDEYAQYIDLSAIGFPENWEEILM